MNDMRRPPLPNFEKPPLTEVALSIQFEELVGFRVIHLGLLWERFYKAELPGTEEHPPVPQTVEFFGTPTLPQPPLLQLLNVPPMPRYLFLSADGNTVVQVQQDRFTVNWRKRLSSDEYPRFEAILERFKTYAERFEQFLRDESLGSLKVTQAEVSYVNRIEANFHPGKIEKVLAVFSGDYSDNFLHDPEEVHLSLRFPMKRDDNLFGRLYIDSRPGVSGDAQSTVNMILVARGKPNGDDINAAQEFFAIAREYIVSAFASVTSKEMHVTWERIDHA